MKNNITSREASRQPTHTRINGLPWADFDNKAINLVGNVLLINFHIFFKIKN